MKISYTWLKSYVPNLPEPEKLRDIFTYHLCEVEGVEQVGKDTVYDINILPNRAHDLLCHRGIAFELAALLGLEYKDIQYGTPAGGPTGLKVKVTAEACRRYMGRIIRGVKVAPTEGWMKEHLESIGQRSINTIVDATNVVMFDRGNPIHAFDLKKLAGEKIIVRQARDGEELTTLGRDQVKAKLDSSMMVIADDDGVLALAGVKGGKKAEVDEHTTDLVIEVANFDPVSVRKTAKKTGIRTDSSKRFENDFSPELAPAAMNDITALILELNPTATVEEIVDAYPAPQAPRTLRFSCARMASLLGRDVPEAEVEDVLGRYHFTYQKDGDAFTLDVPPARLDLVIEEDMAEEFGRIAGYDKVAAKLPSIQFAPKTNETHAKIAAARRQLLADGYSEVMTYTFASKGEVGVLESASDKKFMRASLADGLAESLKLNKLNAPLLGLAAVKIFEIGTVFKKSGPARPHDGSGAGGEEIHVAWNEKDTIIEKKLGEFEMSPAMPDHPEKRTGSAFHMWSLYPFIARDIAVWVPENVSAEEVQTLIRENAGSLVVRGPELFDQFKKEGKISYAFKLVFQSSDRTLTDQEIGDTMAQITNKINAQNAWQVR